MYNNKIIVKHNNYTEMLNKFIQPIFESTQSSNQLEIKTSQNQRYEFCPNWRLSVWCTV